MKLCSPQQAEGDSSHVKKKKKKKVKAGCLTVSDAGCHMGEIHRLAAISKLLFWFLPFLWEMNGESE